MFDGKEERKKEERRKEKQEEQNRKYHARVFSTMMRSLGTLGLYLYNNS